MFKDIIIGQYINADSVLHRLDPKIKIILTVLYVVVLFIIRGSVPYVLFALMTLCLVLMSKIKPKVFIKGLKPLVFIIVFTAVMNLLLTPGTVLVRFWIFKITYEGLRSAVIMFTRLVMLVTGTSLLTLTTSPLKLTDAIETLLSPLSHIKVPSHEIAMMMSIAIRFIPTLADETDKIQKAQTSRGADFQSGNIITRARAMIPLLVPLFISAFRRADELATAMDSRCYNATIKRTKLNTSRIGKADIAYALVFICTNIIIIMFGYII